MSGGGDKAAFDLADCGCGRCRKKEIPPAARMITNATTTHTQRRRFLPDVGCEGIFWDSSERAGCSVESDIFNSIRFSFYQS
jgi:hypothetical protein